MAVNISAVTGYVEQKSKELIGKAVLGAQSAKLFYPYVGVKGNAKLNLLNTEVGFGDGASCTWEDTATQTLSQRQINVGDIVVMQTICWRAFEQTFLNSEIQTAAGNSTVPFEQSFVDGLLNGIQAKIEETVWKGDTASGDSFDGVIKIVDAESSVRTGLTYTIQSGDTATKIINSVYALIPAKAFSNGKKVVMYVGADMYRKYVAELVANGNVILSNGAVADNVAMPNSMLIPGTNVTIYGVDGLNGTNRVFASYKDNFIYGTDLMSDAENIDIWVSKDNNDAVRFKANFLAGVQVAYPDLIADAKVASSVEA